MEYKIHPNQISTRKNRISQEPNLCLRRRAKSLGLAQNESSKFWKSVLTELQNRGVTDVFIASIGGLSGFTDGVKTVFPRTKIKLCVVHQIRNSLKYVSYKEKVTGSVSNSEPSLQLLALMNSLISSLSQPQ